VKLKKFVLAFAFLSLAAVANAQAQFNITGSIAGRVVSANGRGVRRASVTVMNLNTLESQTRITNDFGYYKVDNLPIIDLYLVVVRSKSYSFLPDNRLVEFSGVEHTVNFTSTQ
jgi:hypothetical protein